MEIRIDTTTITAHEAGALAKLLIETVWSAGDALRDACGVPRETQLRDMPISKFLAFFTENCGMLTTDELNTLLADLNAELYSRRVIKPEDNPANGVELPAASVAGMDDMMRAGDSFAKTEVVVGAGVDLAAVFGAANTDPDALASHPEITGTPPAGAQLDKNGLPWDARIHAASKVINADGAWRQKRGVAADLVATVEAELRSVMALPVPDTHGSPELDADAAKLTAMGGDPGPTMGDIFGVPREYLNGAATPPVTAEARAAGAPPEWTGQIVPPPPPPPTLHPPPHRHATRRRPARRRPHYIPRAGHIHRRAQSRRQADRGPGARRLDRGGYRGRAAGHQRQARLDACAGG